MAARETSDSNRNPIEGGRLIMVPDRLPVSLTIDDNDEWQIQPVSGGLVATLWPMMQRYTGVWVGWTGTASNDEAGQRAVLERERDEYANYRLAPVTLSDEQVQGFYKGFANEIIWPLFHNQFTACNFEPEYWRIYREVNRRFAESVGKQVETGDFIWVHDYHLMTLACELRANGVANRCAFFLHIPFPTLDIFSNLPWWRDFLRAVLAYDFIGFQTTADQSNFLACVEFLYSEIQTSDADDRLIVKVTDTFFEGGYRQLAVSTLPIGINYDSVLDTATSDRTQALVNQRDDSWPETTIALGVDRLDCSKGLPQKLKAFRHALKHYPELRGRIVLDQHIVPSREPVPGSAEQKTEIDRLIGHINGEFTRPGWVPIHYFFGRLEVEELMTCYRIADIALVTPLKEGMSLVAKEYCAARIDDSGVLILSEFAGAQAELSPYALVVNPHDVEGVAARIYDAYRMASDERSRRMHAMRAIVRDNDVFAWVHRFLEAACADEIVSGG